MLGGVHGVFTSARGLDTIDALHMDVGGSKVLGTVLRGIVRACCIKDQSKRTSQNNGMGIMTNRSLGSRGMVQIVP